MEIFKSSIKFLVEYFKSVKADIFGGTSEENEDDDELDIEADPTEGSRLMKPESEDITEQEISNSEAAQRRVRTDAGGGQHQMHRPTMQVTIFMMY